MFLMMFSSQLYLGTMYRVTVMCLVLFCASEASQSCRKVSPCSCKLSDGGVIDLTPISSTDPSQPYFSDTPDPGGSDSYSWNPCTAFTEGDCKDAAVCNIHQNIPNLNYFIIGTQDSASFSYDKDNILNIEYQYQEGEGTRYSYIKLLCDKSEEAGQLNALGEKPDLGSGKYYFELHSTHACASPAPPSTSPSGLSVGSILLIVAFSTLFVYLTVGVLINIFIRKNSGKKVIPNSNFWTGFPGLVKDGTLFVVNRGKSRTYDRI